MALSPFRAPAKFSSNISSVSTWQLTLVPNTHWLHAVSFRLSWPSADPPVCMLRQNESTEIPQWCCCQLFSLLWLSLCWCYDHMPKWCFSHTATALNKPINKPVGSFRKMAASQRNSIYELNSFRGPEWLQRLRSSLVAVIFLIRTSMKWIVQTGRAK